MNSRSPAKRFFLLLLCFRRFDRDPPEAADAAM